MKSLMTAAVTLKPDLAKFERETLDGFTQSTKKIGDKLEKGVNDAGSRAGKSAGDKIGKGVEKGATEGAKKASKSVETEMEKAGKASSDKFAMSWDKVNKLGNKMTLGVTLPAIAAGKASIDAFSRYQDASAAAGVFYGEQSKAIEEFGKTASKNYGMSRVAVDELANGMAPLISQFTAVGERGNVAVDTMKRVGDMSSFFGGSVEEAATAMQSFLSGSSVEPIRRYGVFASEAAIASKALDMGLVKATGSSADLTSAQVRLKEAQQKATAVMKDAKSTDIDKEKATAAVGQAEEALAKVMEGKVPVLTESQKIQARYALVMEQTSQAQGDFARTSDSLANKLKTGKSDMQNAAIALGEKLAPMVVKVSDAIGKLATGFTNLPGPIQNALVYGGLFVALAGPMMKFAKMIQGFWGILSTLASRWGLVTTKATEAAIAQERASGGGGKGSMLGKLGAIAGGGMLVYSGTMGQVDAKKKNEGFSWSSFLSGVVGGATMGASLGPWGALAGAVAGGAVSAAPAFMAEGGTVEKPGWSWVGEKGKELAYMPAGAQVIPSYESALVAAGGGSTTTNVNMTVQVTGRAYDERELARQLDAIARRAAATNTRTARPVR